MKLNLFLLFTLSILLGSCGNVTDVPDATGNFEATETIVSAESSGKIISLLADEGMVLKAGQVVGYVDTIQLHYRREQLKFSIEAVLARKPEIKDQLAALRSQIEATNHEKSRIESLLKADAATPKQLDDINAQIDLLNNQLSSLQSTLKVTTRTLESETRPLKSQLLQVDDQIQKSKIINPVDGTVLSLYALQNEVVGPGKALYKVADLSTMRLRAYLSGSQLSRIKLGQEVTVQVDEGESNSRFYNGTISWISDKAEFTPKTIQTKDERANLVYPVKIKVKNDGYLKIGMYGEIKFLNQ